MKALISIIFGIFVGLYFVPLEYPILYGSLVEVLLTLLTLTAFLKTDKHKYAEKSLWFCLAVLEAVNLTWFSWFAESMPLTWFVAFVEAGVFVMAFAYTAYRGYETASDEYDCEGSFIILKRPKTIFDYLISCAFNPVSSVSIVAGGVWAGYRKGAWYSFVRYERKDSHIYIRIPEDIARRIPDLIVANCGAKWRLDSNCCHAIQELFPDTKFSMLDSIPAYFSNTIRKVVSDGHRRNSN